MEKICCRCKRNEQEGRWVRVENGKEKRFSYGFCPKCYQVTLAEIQIAFEHRFNKASEIRV